MPHFGETLGADLADLYHAGRYKLAKVADQFGEARSSLHRVQVSDATFFRDYQFGGSLGPAKPAFDDLQDAIIEILAQTQENLWATGAALVMASEEYAATDAEAMRSYQQIRRDLDDASR